jgi:hypothetical protein
LPHQIDAVYFHILRHPRIRFLLADDPGAGKTIMAGLLLKELKQRGLVNRVLIVIPGHLKDQWIREMKEKLCSQDRRNVKLEKPGHFARLQYYFLRLRYDEKFFFGTVLGFFSLLLGTLSIGIPLFPPWNYVLAVIFFVIGFISICKGSR